jgi:DNA polymerase-3 subunit epsilon
MSAAEPTPAALAAKHAQARASKTVALAVAAVAAALALWLGATGALLWATLTPDERNQAAALLGPRAALLLLATVVLLAALAWAVPRLHRRWVLAPALLADQARVLLGSDSAPELSAQAGAELQRLAQTLNQLVAQRRQLRADVAQQVRRASREIEQERNRLAALMSELSQAVVVCNQDGRVLLYNASARAEFRALSPTPALADGAELIGLGRSIYTVLDRRLVAHALEQIEQRQQAGQASPTAQFLASTLGGQMLRVQMAPVRAAVLTEAADPTEAAEAQAAAPPVNGFVLMLANITREFEQASARDELLLSLTEGGRASLGNLSAAVEMLEYPDLDPAQRERFQAVVRDELALMRQRIEDLATRTSQSGVSRWPLEDMLGADLVAAAQRRIDAMPGLRSSANTVDSALWLRIDSFSLLQALAYLAARLADEYGITGVELRLAAAPTPTAPALLPGSPAGPLSHAHLDLVWTGPAMSTETVMGWESDAMRSGSGASPLTLREVVQRQGGEFWFERERVCHQAFFRFLLPLANADQGGLAAAAPVPAPLAHPDSRPTYYDFDLFKDIGLSGALDERRLDALSYTVFDTETTGLEPARGDQILQIGATRLVNGKLRRQESFEQLVDPQRDIPAAGIAIHGITPAMVRGQPVIGAVLPAFHAFAQDTVLVAHNAAFDMRFLQLQEAATGLCFDQPVLDTLLLSAVVHPAQASHRLEDIAGRLGVDVLGRHTALGDALVTAEVFLRLIPLLAELGIHTLGQAREAAQRTFYARVRY